MNVLRVSLLAVAVGFSSAAVGYEKIVFDTDMYTDFDDVGALAMLHHMAKAGECEILATVVSTRGGPSAGMVEMINGYYGRADLPTGGPKGLGMGPGHDRIEDPNKNKSFCLYRELVSKAKGLRFADPAALPDANDVYRKVLAGAADGSVTIVSTGFTTNLRRLLETKGDALSPLDGPALVARKVKAWYAMACRYPEGREYNSMADAESSRRAFRDWPTKVYFLDWTYGRDVFCGVPAARQADGKNLVYEIFKRALSAYGESEKGHPAWDELAVLAAVRGHDRYFGTVRGRFEIVDEGGTNRWTPDPAGRHYVLTERVPKRAVGEIVDALIAAPPPPAALGKTVGSN